MITMGGGGGGGGRRGLRWVGLPNESQCVMITGGGLLSIRYDHIRYNLFVATWAAERLRSVTMCYDHGGRSVVNTL